MEKVSKIIKKINRELTHNKRHLKAEKYLITKRSTQDNALSVFRYRWYDWLSLYERQKLLFQVFFEKCKYVVRKKEVIFYYWRHDSDDSDEKTYMKQNKYINLFLKETRIIWKIYFLKENEKYKKFF